MKYERMHVDDTFALEKLAGVRVFSTNPCTYISASFGSGSELTVSLAWSPSGDLLSSIRSNKLQRNM